MEKRAIIAAMLMAGLDGVENDLDPGSPADYDLFEEDRGRVAPRRRDGREAAREGRRPLARPGEGGCPRGAGRCEAPRSSCTPSPPITPRRAAATGGGWSWRGPEGGW